MPVLSLAVGLCLLGASGPAPSVDEPLLPPPDLPLVAPWRPPRPAPHSAILIEPLTTLVGPVIGLAALSVSYHHAFAPYIGISASLTGSLGFPRVGLITTGVRSTTLGATVGPRVLFTPGRRVAGAYLWPGFSASYGSLTGQVLGSPIDVTVVTLGGRVTSGWMWAWENAFVLNLGGGVRVSTYAGADASQLGAAGILGPLSPLLEFGLGYGWPAAVR